MVQDRQIDKVTTELSGESKKEIDQTKCKHCMAARF